MPKIITDWFKVATAGPSIDGRFIKDQWLLDMAETYDATKRYCAMIWPEHYRWANAGSVVAVKAEKDEMGRLSLYCKLQPNQLLLDYNASEQKLFTSIEVIDDFAKSGKAYLGGLGITDQPASLGTERLAFSKAHPESGTPIFSAPIEAGKFALLTDEQPSLFQKLFRKITDPQSFHTESDDDMKPEQFDALMAANKAQLEATQALAAQFTAVADSFKAGNGGEGGGAGEQSNEQFASEVAELRTKNEALETEISDLKNQFAELRKTPVGGTQTPGNSGTEKQFL